MKNRLFTHTVGLALAMAFLPGCEDGMSSMTTEEAVKDIKGEWTMVQLQRNGEDLSARMPLTDFQLQLHEDGTYTLAEELPFVVAGSGTYKLNDPQYPFSLILTPEGTNEEAIVGFQYPVIKGKRQLSLTFSLGCTSNSYQYNFERKN